MEPSVIPAPERNIQTAWRPSALGVRLANDDLLFVQNIQKQAARKRQEIKSLLEEGRICGMEGARRLSAMTDSFIRKTVAFTKLGTRLRKNGSALCAYGEYGRNLLSPFHSLPLLCLGANPLEADVKTSLEHLLHLLWEAGFTLSFHFILLEKWVASFQSGADHAAIADTLSLRFLAGSDLPVETLRENLHERLQNPDFLRRIFDDLGARIGVYANFSSISTYILEPDLKRGHGAMDDLEVLNTAAAAFALSQCKPGDFSPSFRPERALLREKIFTRAELQRLTRMEGFFWTLRLAVEFLGNNANSILESYLQPVIAHLLKIKHRGGRSGADRLMQKFYLVCRGVKRLQNVFYASLEAWMDAREGSPTASSWASAAEPPPNPARLLEEMEKASAFPETFSPRLTRDLIRSENRFHAEGGIKAFGPKVFNLLLRFSPDLARSDQNPPFFWAAYLNETGVLTKTIPGWNRILGRRHLDGNHVFTIDKHIVRALRLAALFKTGALGAQAPLATRLAASCPLMRVLFAALLLHDLEGVSSPFPALAAQETAKKIGPNLGLTPGETEKCAWLLLHHTLLQDALAQNALPPPDRILKLAGIIQSPMRLITLYLFTLADCWARSPDESAWQEPDFFHTLFEKIMAIFLKGVLEKNSETKMRQLSWNPGTEGGFDQDAYALIQQIQNPPYWLNLTPEQHLEHFSYLLNAEEEEKTGLGHIEVKSPASGKISISAFLWHSRADCREFGVLLEKIHRPFIRLHSFRLTSQVSFFEAWLPHQGMAPEEEKVLLVQLKKLLISPHVSEDSSKVRLKAPRERILPDIFLLPCPREQGFLLEVSGSYETEEFYLLLAFLEKLGAVTRTSKVLAFGHYRTGLLYLDFLPDSLFEQGDDLFSALRNIFSVAE